MRVPKIKCFLAALFFAGMGLNPALAQNDGSEFDSVGEELIYAIENDERVRLETMLAMNADVNEVVPGKGTALIAASRKGDHRLITLLTAFGAQPDLAVAGVGTPLSVAAGAGHLDAIEALIGEGANPNAGASTAGTPLINAARTGQLKALEKLIEWGADPSLAVLVELQSGPQLWSPLGEAKKYKHGEIIEYLEAVGAIERTSSSPSSPSPLSSPN